MYFHNELDRLRFIFTEGTWQPADEQARCLEAMTRKISESTPETTDAEDDPYAHGVPEKQKTITKKDWLVAQTRLKSHYDGFWHGYSKDKYVDEDTFQQFATSSLFDGLERAFRAHLFGHVAHIGKPSMPSDSWQGYTTEVKAVIRERLDHLVRLGKLRATDVNRCLQRAEFTLGFHPFQRYPDPFLCSSVLKWANDYMLVVRPAVQEVCIH